SCGSIITTRSQKPSSSELFGLPRLTQGDFVVVPTASPSMQSATRPSCNSLRSFASCSRAEPCSAPPRPDQGGDEGHGNETQSDESPLAPTSTGEGCPADRQPFRPLATRGVSSAFPFGVPGRLQ